MEEKFYNDELIKEQNVPWLVGEMKRFNNPLAVTLTFPKSSNLEQEVKKMTGIRNTPNKQQAVKKLKKLHRQLSRSLLKSANKNFNKMINLIPIIEGEPIDNTHFHLVLDCHYKSKIEMARKIEQLWSGTIKVDDIYNDAGWIGYITKHATKENYNDSLVVECLSLMK